MSIEEQEFDLQQKQTQRSELLTDIAIGISDGLVVPFALVTGLSVVVSSTLFVALAGAAAVIAGSVAMGFGGFFTTRSEMTPHRNEHEEADHDSERKQQWEIKRFYSSLGLSEDTQEQVAAEVFKDKENWTDVVQNYQLQNQKFQSNRAAKSGFTIALSYFFGGLVPLLPYMFFTTLLTALQYSICITAIALFVFGWIKNSLTGTNVWAGALRQLMFGLLAAGAAYLVALIFKGY